MFRINITNAITIAVLLVAVYCESGQGQVLPPTILEIDIENLVQYYVDTSDLSKFATEPNATPAGTARNFREALWIGDIVAVNGQPAKGTTVLHARGMGLSMAPNPGQAIADTVRSSIIDQTFEILQADSTPIGTILVSGLSGGTAPPGAPLSITQGNFAIVGGTGAFLGARGQIGQAVNSQTTASRQASMVEDPANRRGNGGGGRVRFVGHVIPMSRPEIVQTLSGPAVFHAGFAPVTAANPAKSGEVLIVRATGLGPTRPGVNPGQPFPVDTLLSVNSPVEVRVNGQSAEVTNKIGWPTTLDSYRVDFRVPDGTTAGMAEVQLSGAWIAGAGVSIPIQ